MNHTHRRNGERAQRVVTSINSQPEDFPEDSKAASLASSLKQELTRLHELDVIRSSSMSKRKQGTAARRNTHKLLLALVRRVIDTADAIALDRANFEGMFVRPQRNASTETLIADARSIAEKAASVIGLFTENGLPPTIINDLKSYADSLEQSMQLQTEGASESVRANAEINSVIRRMKGLIERLNVIVRNQYGDDHAKLTAWESACRLEKPPHSHRNSENNAAPVPPQ